LNYIIGKAEDPEKILNQMLIDMDDELINAKRQVAVAISDEKKILTQYLDSRKKMSLWKEKAEEAVEFSRDDLARKALERYTLYKQESVNLENHWKNQKNAVEKLKKALRNLTIKINDAKVKKNLLIARAKQASATQNISTTMQGMTGGKNTLRALNQMEEKISKMEAEAQVTHISTSEMDVDDLHLQFDELKKTPADATLYRFKKHLKARKTLELDNKHNNNNGEKNK